MSGESYSLVVIDMQDCFADPESDWFTPRYREAEANITRLSALSTGDSTVWTRFVRDPDEQGSWSAYYDRWNELRLPPEAKEWDLTSAPAEGDDILDLPTFSKWGPDLGELTADADGLVVCGVATDCCVLGTVLGAVDAGRPVTVVSDACAGVTDTAHQQALDLMGLLSPMITLTETKDFLAQRA
ncbi:MAG: cysteine hydrolase [Solirubrobacterales bacterium]|nr:cysteine hydrolase [Solirubrobacterales bacterium]